MKLIIEDDEGRRTVVPFVRDELTIGRNEDNIVRLTEKNVSRKHGKLVRKDGRFYVEDLNSFTGIRVNGERVKGKRVIKEGDLIQISEFDLSLQSGPDDRTPPPDGGGLGDDEEEATVVKGQSGAGPGTAAPEEPTQPGIKPVDPAAEAAAEFEARKNAATAIIRLSDLPAGEHAASDTQELPEEQRPRLVCLAGTLRGKEFILDRTPVKIGRSDENDLRIDHPSISRTHCRLSLENDAWKVLDAESRNGVRVNGEPYAASGVRSGDTVELGHLKFAFVGPGQKFALPPALNAQPAAGAPSSSRAILVGIAAALAVVTLGGLFLWRRARAAEVESASAAEASQAAAERKYALHAAEEALAAHRYGEAVRHLEASRAHAAHVDGRAISLGAARQEARAEELYQQLEAAMGGQDFDRARRLADELAASPQPTPYYAARAAEKVEAVKTGYVNQHVAASALAKGKDNGACLSEAKLALAAAPDNSDAQQLVEACKPASQGDRPAPSPRPRPAAMAAPSAPAEPPPAPVVAAASAAPVPAALSAPPAPAPAKDGDTEARRLINEGNQKLIALDYPAAIASFQGALAQRPSDPVLANAYRSMGITFTRQGNAEEGAHYYKLYLPLCTNPTERQHLQKLLDDYEARRR